MASLLKSALWGSKMSIAAPSRATPVSTGSRSVVTMAKKKGKKEGVCFATGGGGGAFRRRSSTFSPSHFRALSPRCSSSFSLWSKQ